MAVAAHHPMTNSHTAAVASRVGPVGLSDPLSRVVQLWRGRIRERHTLALFDHRDLKDVGLSRWDAERELAKPFWRG